MLGSFSQGSLLQWVSSTEVCSSIALMNFHKQKAHHINGSDKDFGFLNARGGI